MNFDVFDKSEMEQYKAEAKAKWGDTKAWQEYEQRTAAQNDRDYDKLANDLMAMFSEMGAMRQMHPDHKAVQEKIAVLQQFITENYYVCTDEILSGLGEMYVCDERFRKNIDKAGGEGTAKFVRQAISVFCAG